MIALGSNTVGIGLVVKLRDQFSANANHISNQFNQMYGNANRAMKQNLVAARQVGMGMMLIGAGGTMAFANATNAAAEFNYTLTGVKAATNATTEQMKMLHDQAIKVGMQSKFTAMEVASAMEYLSKAGFEIPDVSASIDAVAALGAAADMMIGGKEGAAGVMANILNTFGLAASKAPRVADIMARAAVKSSIDIADLAESIKYSGSVATMLKVPFEDLTSMIAVLGNAGIRGSMAGVGLANMMMYLSKAVNQFRTKRQADALTALGLHPSQLIDAQGNLKPMLDIVNEFRKSMSHLSTTKQVSVLEGLMNIRGARAFVPLFRKSEIGMTLPEMLADVRDNATGAAKAMANMRMDTLKGDMMILADTWNAFKIEVGETLEPIVRAGVKFMTKVVGGLIKFAKTPIGKPLLVVAAGLSVALAIGGALIVTMTSISLLTIASTVSFANMGKALVWAWNSATASALRYATAAQAANVVSTPWGLRGAGGRFVKGGQVAMTGLGFWGTIRSGFTRLMGAVGGLAGVVGWLGRALKVVTGPIGWFVGLIQAMFGFKNIVKLLVMGLGSLLQAIMFIPDVISGWINGEGIFGAFTYASNEFKRRNSEMAKALGFEKTPLENWISKPAGSGKQYVGDQNLEDRIMQGLAEIKARKAGEAKVYLDSTQVGKVMFENELEEALWKARSIKD